MNRLTTLAALVAAAVIATHAESAWPDETTANESAAPAEQTPAPASPVVPGGYAQTWQQPPRWRAPQQFLAIYLILIQRSDNTRPFLRSL